MMMLKICKISHVYYLFLPLSCCCTAYLILHKYICLNAAHSFTVQTDGAKVELFGNAARPLFIGKAWTNEAQEERESASRCCRAAPLPLGLGPLNGLKEWWNQIIKHHRARNVDQRWRFQGRAGRRWPKAHCFHERIAEKEMRDQNELCKSILKKLNWD